MSLCSSKGRVPWRKIRQNCRWCDIYSPGSAQTFLLLPMNLSHEKNGKWLSNFPETGRLKKYAIAVAPKADGVYVIIVVAPRGAPVCQSEK
jgi:hypothetical protein